jgi:hypothetical protein
MARLAGTLQAPARPPSASCILQRRRAARACRGVAAIDRQQRFDALEEELLAARDPDR